jgi:hypothetical protein
VIKQQLIVMCYAIYDYDDGDGNSMMTMKLQNLIPN